MSGVIRAATALVCLVIGSLSCAGDDELTPSAQIEVDPPEIDFGEVRTGVTRAIELHIRNRSPTGTLELPYFGLADGTPPVFTLSAPPQSLAPGAEATVVVRYTADDGDADAGHIQIETNVPGSSQVLVPLSSAATFPKLVVSPEEIDVGRIVAGLEARRTLTLGNDGLAPLVVRRLSVRTDGFLGEVCTGDETCREGRCARSRTGRICAAVCERDTECSAGYACTTGTEGLRACREMDGTRPPLSARGFVVSDPGAIQLAPDASTTIDVLYRPGADDRGAAWLVVESNDPAHPYRPVSLLGRPENLPPIADAALVRPPPTPTEPGTQIEVSGLGSSDPEGAPLTWQWSFVRRPEGSRATFADTTSSTTTFAVDLPGEYVVGLRVRDEGGLASTNDARVSVVSTAGRRVRVELRWDQDDSDLDLHLVSPGSAVGSVGDCFFDNPSPDWGPIGPDGDPVLTTTTAHEVIAVDAPADGVYTLLVRVPAASPRGAARAEVRIYFNDVEAALFEAILPVTAEQWDVATMSRPSGRLIPLATIR